MQYEAVRLFVARAAMTAPSFALTRDTAPAVAQICQRLDGIPLAIALAAPPGSALPVPQIAGRLDDRVRLLTGGQPTPRPPRATLHPPTVLNHALLSPPV